MPGFIDYAERAIVTLQDRTNTTALAHNSAVAAAVDLDARGTGNAPDDWFAMFELLCRWGTITGITANVAVAELYLIPALDGTNFADVDLTAGASSLPLNGLMGSFVAGKAAVANTDQRYVLGPVPLFPVRYRAYLLNSSGQTVTTTSGTSWQLRLVSAQGAYT